MDVNLTKLVNLDLNGKTITGNVTMTSDTTGSIDIKAGIITGNLTVDAKNATINNSATVKGTLTIKDVKSGTWNENVSGNTLVFEAKGKTLKVADDVTVKSLTINQNATVITIKALNAVVAMDVEVIVKNNAAVSDDDAIKVIGTVSTDPVELDPTEQEVDESKVMVSNKEDLEKALTTELVKEITIVETIGSKNAYTVYNVERAVTIKGGADAKVFGTFMVKADNVIIENLAIQNQGDLGGNQNPSPQVRGNIIVYAKNVSIINNTLTHGLGEEEGLANAIQIFSNVQENPLSNYKITNNNIVGFNNKARGSSSVAIIIAQGYKSTVIGKKFAEIITVREGDYEKLLNNTLKDNTINLEHSDWSSGSGVILYPVEDTKEAVEKLRADFAIVAEESLKNITVDNEVVTYAYNADIKEATITIINEEISVKDVSGTGAILALERLVNTEGLKGFQINGGNDRKDITSYTQIELKEAIIFEMAAAIALPDAASLNTLGQLKDRIVTIKVYLENEGGIVAEDSYKISFK